MTLLGQSKSVDFVRTVWKNLSNLLEQMEFELITVELITVSPAKIVLNSDGLSGKIECPEPLFLQSMANILFSFVLIEKN